MVEVLCKWIHLAMMARDSGWCDAGGAGGGSSGGGTTVWGFGAASYLGKQSAKEKAESELNNIPVLGHFF